MGIKEIFRLIKFLWKSDSCVVLKDNLVLSYFGKEEKTLRKFENRIMLISLRDSTPDPKNIEEAAALRIHDRAATAGTNYAEKHGHSIIEEVAYGRGYKSGYMLGYCEMYKKMCDWLKKNVTFTHPRKGTEECPINFGALNDAMCKDED